MNQVHVYVNYFFLYLLPCKHPRKPLLSLVECTDVLVANATSTSAFSDLSLKAVLRSSTYIFLIQFFRLITNSLNRGYFFSHLPRGGMGEASPSPAFRREQIATLGAFCSHTEYADLKLFLELLKLTCREG